MEICSKCKMPVGEWNETRRRERLQVAAMAMQGLTTAQPNWALANCNPGTWQENVKLAVQIADALLAELEREK